ncbi:hypothetical protein JCM25156A_32150 [Komagataeibacter kakiaceti JCM 25156]
MDDVSWGVIGGCVLAVSVAAGTLIYLSRKAQTAATEAQQVDTQTKVTTTEQAMAQAQADAPATDADLTARLDGGTF